MKLNFQQVLKILSEETKLSEAKIKAVFNSFEELLRNYEEIRLPFGKFLKKEYNSRKVRNPLTGETKIIPKRTRVVFKPYKSLVFREEEVIKKEESSYSKSS